MDNKENKEEKLDIEENTVDKGDEVVFENDSESNPVLSGNTVEKLRKRLKECESLKQEYLSGWQRAKADFVNIRKRDEEANKEFLKFAKEDIIVQFIPVLDSFEMAFSNKEAWGNVPKEWRMGVEYIYSQLLSILENNGVKQLNSKDVPFDPRIHDAVETIETKIEKEDNIVLEVIQKGYTLHEKVIKSTKVKVGKYEAE